MRASDHADKVGIFGAGFAALCCLGIPAVLGIVTSIGAGFLIHDAILLPLLVLSLLVTLWGLSSGWRRHHNPTAILVGVVGGIGLFVFSFIHQSRGLALTSIVALVAEHHQCRSGTAWPWARGLIVWVQGRNTMEARALMIENPHYAAPAIKEPVMKCARGGSRPVRGVRAGSRAAPRGHRALPAAGYNRVYVHQVDPDQEGFFRFYEREVLPRVAPASDEEGSGMDADDTEYGYSFYCPD